MISRLDDQQLSSMQSTSELGDSRKKLRQVECCVHGRPCAIASKLSREKEEKANHDSSSGSHNLTGSGYKSFFEKSESHVNHHDDSSYKLRKKIEREGILIHEFTGQCGKIYRSRHITQQISPFIALDVPVSTWNFGASHSSTSPFTSEPITRVSEVEDVGLLRIPSKERTANTSTEFYRKALQHTGHRAEHLGLSRTMDAPPIGQMKKLTTSKERHDQYEMMRPTTLAPPPMSKEHAVRTTRIHGSAEVSPSVEAYIGILTAKQAEEYIIKPASFKLYHLMPKIDSLNDVLPSLGLYIIYRSGTGHV
uniref:SH2 domain-containing protein n=1 Tax=Loa loa TaxID=7209 RepID=A0A1I7VQ45_LOALO